MSNVDVIYEKIHARHDPRWSRRLAAAESDGPLLCVACVTEMMESREVSSVRRSLALSGVAVVLRSSPGALSELLQQDNRFCLRFTASLLDLLHTTKDPATLEKVDQVLVLLLLDLQSDMLCQFVLDHIHKQLSDQFSVKDFMSTFNFLGSLMDTVPAMLQSLVNHHRPLLEHLYSAWLYPDETLQASVICVWLKVLGAAGGSGFQSLPAAIRDRVCGLLLKTLANASYTQLITSCTGLLWLLVQREDAVSVLMNGPGDQLMCEENQKIPINNRQSLIQNQEQQPHDHCRLPLLLKKLLLSGDEAMQVTSAKCIASVLVHSPSQYGSPFIKADVPEFLFDCLASSRSEVLLWSAYSCLVLLTEDPVFFSQCHSIYGIDSLVRSLNEALQLTNLDVPKQGLLLLTEVLERQPSSMCLFPTSPGFVAVCEAVLRGLFSSCLLVATQAAAAATALFRLNHQSKPVQYRELKRLVETITARLSHLPLPSSAYRRSCGSLKKLDPRSLALKPGGFILQAMTCFQAACKLAEVCLSEPELKENMFTAPSKHSLAQDTVESLCQCLLHCCDSVWIPTVTRMCEYAPNPQILQFFYSILSSQFVLLPCVMPVFANKLASCGFFRLALEHKFFFCAQNRNPHLNTSCCGFLQKLSMCLLSHSGFACGSDKNEVVETLLQHNLPSLCYRLSDWPSLLCEAPGLQLSEFKGRRATQYCLVILLHLALQQGDRLLPDQTVFSCVVWMLCSLQEEGSYPLPTSVLRSALYLLAATQDMSASLEGAALACINKTLSSCQSFSSLYIHHPALLHFICRYPELAEKFGPMVLELWLTKKGQYSNTDVHVTDEEEERKKCESGAEKRRDQAKDIDLLSVLNIYPAVSLTVLDMVLTREPPLAEQALAVLEAFLCCQRDYEADLCNCLRSTVLQALQRHSVENLGQGHTGQVNSLPLLLKLLCVMHASDPPSSQLEIDGVHFKLLYYVSNIAGRLMPTNTESLLPAFNYQYCVLSVSSAHFSDRAVSMLLSNIGLMNQLQMVLSSSSSSSHQSALLCCSHLLLASLITLQHAHSSQVHKRISWSLETAIQRILLQKRNSDNLLLVSYLKLVQALLSVDLESAVVSVRTGPGLVGSRPLDVEDGALYPLCSRGAQCLSLALSGLLFQKHELLLRASANCLSSLIGFLQRKSPPTAKYIICQPWSRFLSDCLLSSEDSCLLHPAILTFFTLLLQQDSPNGLWEPDLFQLMDAAERRGMKELSQEAACALRLLLTQILSRVSEPLTEKHTQRARSLLDTLHSQPPVESCSFSNILRIGNVSICLSDFLVKMDG